MLFATHFHFFLEKYGLFQILPEDKLSTEGLPYDYQSVQHPDKYYTTSNGQPTLMPLKDVGPPNTGLFTAFDYLHINLVYCQGML